MFGTNTTVSKKMYGPGPRILDSPITSIGEWEHWKHSVLFTLRQEPDFRKYLNEDFIFGAKSSITPTRGLRRSGTGAEAVTAEDKC